MKGGMAEQPRPKSPPGLYGKRRQQAKLELLEREIGLLQEELKSLEGVQPSSRCCKELNEFVATKPDPFLAINEKCNESNCSWKRASGCCKSEKVAHNQQQVVQNKQSGCCCCCRTRKRSCLKLCCSCDQVKVCSSCCFGSGCCCSFKSCCSMNCCTSTSKVKLCPTSCSTCCCC